MEPRSLQYIAEASSGQRLNGSPYTLVRRVCTDSRQVQSDDLFVALAGERFDVHAFLSEVEAKGVAGAVVDRTRVPSPLPACALVAVENTRRAFGQIAARYRRDFSLPLVAVGGSNGKTTTKELIATVLRQRYQTLSSPASFNNEIGVPATLLELTGQHQAAVLEFGTNHPGELAALLELAQPRFGVIPSIGREHLEFFGDLNGVIQEEGMLAELLPADGKLFINGDTPGALEIARRSAAPVVRAGLSSENLWRATSPRLTEAGGSFDVQAPAAAYCRRFHVPLLGRHQAVNALLTLAVAAELGLTPEEAQSGLALCTGAKMRLQLSSLNGVHLLDDSYNANADSVRAALETLHDFPARGRRVAVLGDMAELGVHSNAAHREIGQFAARLGIDRLLAIGSMASILASSARQAGLKGVEEFTDVTEVARALHEFVQPGDVILVKASRAAALERVGDLLRRDLGSATSGRGRAFEPKPDPIAQG